MHRASGSFNHQLTLQMQRWSRDRSPDHLGSMLLITAASPAASTTSSASAGTASSSAAGVPGIPRCTSAGRIASAGITRPPDGAGSTVIGGVRPFVYPRSIDIRLLRVVWAFGGLHLGAVAVRGRLCQSWCNSHADQSRENDHCTYFHFTSLLLRGTSNKLASFWREQKEWAWTQRVAVRYRTLPMREFVQHEARSAPACATGVLVRLRVDLFLFVGDANR